jgi:hypothetical protein
MAARKERERDVRPRVSVVIPNWNGEAHLPRCLASLRRQSFQDFELILVDNGSVDDSLAVVRAMVPEARLLRFPDNRGFSVAVNAGIAAAQGAEIALLNSDVELDPGWLEVMVDTLDRYPAMSALASKMVQARDRRRLDGIGLGCLAGGIGYRIGSHEPDEGQYAVPVEVLGPCAGAALYRRRVFEVAGVFDEDFFAYHEDVDLTLRSQWAGLRCLFVPAAMAYHVGGGSTGGTMNGFIARLSTRNRYWVGLKNLPAAMLLRALPQMLAYEACWSRRLAACGLLGPYLRGLHEALAGLGRMRAKRQAVARTRRVSVTEFSRTLRASERMVLASLARRYAHRRRLAGALRWAAARGLP